MAEWKFMKLTIIRQYGLSSAMQVSILEKEVKRSTKIMNDIVFLKRCWQDSITPNFLKIKNCWAHLPKSPKLLQHLQRQLLKEEIHWKFRKLANSKNIFQKILHSLPFTDDILLNLTNLLDITKEKVNLESKNRQKKKFSRLQDLQCKPTVHNFQTSNKSLKSIHPNTSVKNLSRHEFSPEELTVLSLGLNFAIPDKEVDKRIIESFINTELFLSNNSNSIDSTTMDQIRMKTSRIIQHHKSNQDHSSEHQWILPIIQKLRKDSSIKIMPADKGNVTVILDTGTYESKISHLLDDPNYASIDKVPTKNLEMTIKSKCASLLKRKRISKGLYQHMTNSGSKIPRFYGLPKIHKSDVPLRPIVDFRDSPTYNIANYLNKLLKSETKKFPSTLKNSIQFAKELKHIRIPPKHIMVSFDVKFLFTQVPIGPTLKYIEERLKISNTWKENCSLSIEDVLVLTEMTLQSNYFKWKDKIYKQIEGTPMGSPISPVFAEFFMQSLEEMNILKNSNIFYWKRFVDDIFSIIPEDKIKSTLSEINSFHPSIEFTIETENDRKLPFLDSLVERDINGEIHLRVYRKPTHSGRYLNFSSFHHPSQKLAVIDCLVYRAISACDEEYLEDELNLIESQLRSNGYPSPLIRRRILKMKTRFNIKKDEYQENQTSNRIILPYTGSLTTKLTRSILKILPTCSFGYIPGRKIKNTICNHKEKEDPDEVGVYTIECLCHQKYIGETRRDLQTRMNEHRRDVKSKNPNSALASHIMDHPDHRILWDSASLIVPEQKNFHRKFYESLLIRSEKRRMNRDLGMEINPILAATLVPMVNSIKNKKKINHRENQQC